MRTQNTHITVAQNAKQVKSGQWQCILHLLKKKKEKKLRKYKSITKKNYIQMCTMMKERQRETAQREQEKNTC